jgi:hypothetical protein
MPPADLDLDRLSHPELKDLVLNLLGEVAELRRTVDAQRDEIARQGRGRVGNARLSDRAVANVVKDCANRVGPDAAQFSGHSLRAGFLTSAARRGASIFKMMDASRHKSMDTARLRSRCRPLSRSRGRRAAVSAGGPAIGCDLVRSAAAFKTRRQSRKSKPRSPAPKRWLPE